MDDNAIRLLAKIRQVNGMKIVGEGEELLTVVIATNTSEVEVLVYVQSENILYEWRFDYSTLRYLNVEVRGCRVGDIEE